MEGLDCYFPTIYDNKPVTEQRVFSPNPVESAAVSRIIFLAAPSCSSLSSGEDPIGDVDIENNTVDIARMQDAKAAVLLLLKFIFSRSA